MTSTRCAARVQFGSSTYAMRNRDRQCANPATDNGFCHVHQRFVVAPIDRNAFEAVRRSLVEDNR